VNLSHFLHRGKLGLAAAGALSAAENETVRTHASTCGICGPEFEEMQLAHRRLLEDAAIERPLPISSAALRTRVLAKIREEGRRPQAARGWTPVHVMGALALVGVGVIVGSIVTRTTVTGPTSVASSSSTSDAPDGDEAMNAAFYERLEKTQTRANAARYLAEAQDVLIQVTAAADCPDSPDDNVDVKREAATSRSLLQRRAALVAGSPEALVAARGVMEEVEGLLHEVAELPQCTRRSDVDAIVRRVDRKKLLMKIDLVAQELAAP
jgi:hypothetical protein